MSKLPQSNNRPPLRTRARAAAIAISTLCTAVAIAGELPVRQAKASQAGQAPAHFAKASTTIVAATAESLAAAIAVDAAPSATSSSRLPSVGAESATIGLCLPGRIYFDGACREPMFFQRFKSSGATYLGVYGPTHSSEAHDTGVIVVERLGPDVAQYVYVLPDKVAAGAPRSASTQYRKDYPLAGITTASTWIDSSNRMNTMGTFWRRVAATTGSAARFGVAEWSHRAETASGYRLTDSNGLSLLAQASGGTSATDTCKAASTAQGESLAGICKLASLAGAGAVGVAAGVSSGVFLSTASFGVGIPAATAAGVAIGGVTFTVLTATFVSVCQNLGDSFEASLQARCPLVAAGTAAVPEIRPTPTADADSFAQGECPTGQVKYSGVASYCTDGGNDYGGGTMTLPNPDGTTTTVEVVSVDANYVCTAYQASGQCLPISSFG